MASSGRKSLASSTRKFTAVRRVLELGDFALAPDTEPPPSDLVDVDTWHGIMDLPDDVSIQTSNHHGNQLKELYELWGAWIESIGHEEDPLFAVMLDATDEFQASTFNSLHGYYRQAIGSLRNALELVAIGAYYQVSNNVPEFKSWQAGEIEISFGRACDGLSGTLINQSLNSHIRSSVNDTLFDQAQKVNNKPGGWARRLYSWFSDYSHSRPTFTNADMWNSNGPIYEGHSFLLATDVFFQTSAICYLIGTIARSTLIVPSRAEGLFNSGNGWRTLAHASYEYFLQVETKRP